MCVKDVVAVAVSVVIFRRPGVVVGGRRSWYKRRTTDEEWIGGSYGRKPVREVADTVLDSFVQEREENGGIPFNPDCV